MVREKIALFQKREASINKSFSDKNRVNKIKKSKKDGTKRIISPKYDKLKGTLIILEGTIGVGKTTLGKALEKYLNANNLNARFYPEFKNELLLAQYIRDMPRYAYPFQVIIARERIHIYSEAYRFAQDGGIAIIDRSLIGDYVFASMQRNKGFFTDEEWQVYNSLIQNEQSSSNINKLPEPSIIIYLQADPETVYQRMTCRGEESEKSGYSLSYFQDLHNAYEQVIEKLDHKVTKLDWNKDRKIIDISACQYVLDLI